VGEVGHYSGLEIDARCAVVLESIHYVMKGERLLKRAGIRIDVIPVPREISSDCGMALEFSCQDRRRVEDLLAEDEMAVVGIYRLRRGRYWLKQ